MTDGPVLIVMAVRIPPAIVAIRGTVTAVIPGAVTIFILVIVIAIMVIALVIAVILIVARTLV